MLVCSFAFIIHDFKFLMAESDMNLYSQIVNTVQYSELLNLYWAVTFILL